MAFDSVTFARIVCLSRLLSHLLSSTSTIRARKTKRKTKNKLSRDMRGGLTKHEIPTLVMWAMRIDCELYATSLQPPDADDVGSLVPLMFCINSLRLVSVRKFNYLRGSNSIYGWIVLLCICSMISMLCRLIDTVLRLCCKQLVPFSPYFPFVDRTL